MIKISDIEKRYHTDDPTANLDHDNGKEVMDLLDELNKEGATIIMVTHSENDAEYSHGVIRLPDIPVARQY